MCVCEHITGNEQNLQVLRLGQLMEKWVLYILYKTKIELT